MTAPLMVFGDDHSTYADRAWLWINNQCWRGWSVDIVTASYDPGDLWSDELPVRLTRWQSDAPRKAFADCEIAGIQHLHSNADIRLVLGSRGDADLIVIGPKGNLGLKPLLLGSTAEHLLHLPPAPLVIAKTSEPAERVLVCIDGSANAQTAVETFSSLPLATNAVEIAVLGVTTAHDDVGVVTRGLEQAAETLPMTKRDIIVAEADESVAGTILEHSAAQRAQLVVMGTRGHTGLKRILLGSTTSSVVRLTRAATLIVPPGGNP